ncbi:DUF2505 domain-containing protein [Demequina sediminicola]|uniref:DUF2505 domain-containing protein n=1 Tax=Demequina sediminicola TaxID=1095026 RepID=UPI00078423F8|nr:DUF2505 domain-containing protein [Demequina sediminicola]
MKFTHSHRFDADVAAVIAMLADAEFVQRRGRSASSAQGEALLSGTVEDGFAVSVRRAVPSSSIPAEFRGMVGSDVTVRYTEVWLASDDAVRTGTFSVEIVGAPGHAKGTLELTPDDEGSVLTLDGTVDVKIPLVGSMIEKQLVKAVSSNLEDEFAMADEWLSEHK